MPQFLSCRLSQTGALRFGAYAAGPEGHMMFFLFQHSCIVRHCTPDSMWGWRFVQTWCHDCTQILCETWTHQLTSFGSKNLRLPCQLQNSTANGCFCGAQPCRRDVEFEAPCCRDGTGVEWRGLGILTGEMRSLEKGRKSVDRHEAMNQYSLMCLNVFEIFMIFGAKFKNIVYRLQNYQHFLNLSPVVAGCQTDLYQGTALVWCLIRMFGMDS